MGGNPVSGAVGQPPTLYFPVGNSAVAGIGAILPGALVVSASAGWISERAAARSTEGDASPVFLPLRTASDPWSVDALMPFADPAVVVAQQRAREAAAGGHSPPAFLELPAPDAAMEAAGKAFVEKKAGMSAAGWLDRISARFRTEKGSGEIPPHAEVRIGGRTYTVGPDVRRIAVNTAVPEAEVPETLSLYDADAYPAALVISRAAEGGAWEIERSDELNVEALRGALLEDFRVPTPAEPHHVVLTRRIFSLGQGTYRIRFRRLALELTAGIRRPKNPLTGPVPAVPDDLAARWKATRAAETSQLLRMRAQWERDLDHVALEHFRQDRHAEARRRAAQAMREAEKIGMGELDIVRHNVRKIASAVRFGETVIGNSPDLLVAEMFLDQSGRIVAVCEYSSMDTAFACALGDQEGLVRADALFEGGAWTVSGLEGAPQSVRAMLEKTLGMLNLLR